MPVPRPQVAVVCGYFDWFSGYQETALVGALSSVADVEVIASNRVSTMFSDSHLKALEVPRVYPTSHRVRERGVLITRLPVRELRSMVWSWRARRVLRNAEYDLIVQVMPGQLLPLAATIWGPRTAPRVVLYGDNSAMWSALSPWQRRIKWAIFTVTKGLLYIAVNRRARAVYNYTPETLRRLSRFQPSGRAELMPLTFRTEDFFPSDDLRTRWRAELGFDADDLVVVTAGKFTAYKELERLLDAFRSAAREAPNLKLALAGADDSSYTQQLRRQVADDPVLAERTTFVGFLDTEALNGFLNAGDIGVWPKLPAVTIQQAMGTGLYVVLPRNDWVGHLVKDASAGRYFEPEQDGALTEALGSAASQLQRGAEQRAARAETNRWFSADGVAARLLEILGSSSQSPE